LLSKYEDKLKDAPDGDTFEKLYDTKTLEPLPHYQQLYGEVKAEFENQGLKFRG
jgi:hypothetical protein